MNTFLLWDDIYKQEASFGARLEKALTIIGILEDCKKLPICHVCVRIKNPENVTELKAKVGDIGNVISTAVVNGREILIIQLHSPLIIKGWSIWGVELPYPKQNHSYEDGLEHVEFVLEDTENTMKAIRKRFFEIVKNKTEEELKNNYLYSEDEPQAEGDQKPNPTISIKVNGVGIKFHALPIQRVVGFEA